MSRERPELKSEAAPSAPTPGPGETAAPREVMPGPEELLREAELKAAEHHDAWLRAKAEAENTRKRAQEDIAKAHKFGVERFAS